ncbi:hypothetical protein ACFUTV_40900 [Streptomyces sp. NPDC057298]|uniref:hypothetical protein n=1 Tax=Streptomyces sp. NPDC057298 TaxID=3346091 RepID=UPI0036413461
MTLRALGDEINVSKSQTGAYLAGKVPSEKFIEVLIRATVRPALRERRKEEALALRKRALLPTPRGAPGTPVGPGPGYAVELAAAQARQIETYDRLTRALEQQAEVARAKNNSDKLVMVLLNMIRQLDRRVADLAEERDQLRTRPRSEAALEGAERKLARAAEQEKRARAELQRAEEKQRQAEELEARVKDQLRQLTDELDRLRAGDAASPLDALPDLVEEPVEKLHSTDPVGDDIDAVLARANAVNDEDNDTLCRVSSQLDDVHDEVVQDNPPDILDGYQLALLVRVQQAINVGKGGDPGRAVELLTDLTAKLTSAVGTDDRLTLLARTHWAINVSENGDWQQASEMFAYLIPVLTRVLGPDHLELLTARTQQAINWGEGGGDRARAAHLFAGLIPDLTRVLGPDDRLTLLARTHRAINLGEGGVWARAASLLDSLLRDLTRVLGINDPQTLVACVYYAVSVGEGVDQARAVELLTDLMPELNRALGPQHRATRVARASLARYVGAGPLP